jgi:hypothetical protein
VTTKPDDPRPADEKARDLGEGDEAEDRAAILRRRAVFIASAIAGLGVAAGCGEPQPCLEVAIPAPLDPGSAAATSIEAPSSSSADAGADSGDAGDDAGEQQDAGSHDAGSRDAGSRDAGLGGGGGMSPKPPTPSTCLKVAPRPCLKKAPPRPCLDFDPP